jgi:hypothetical protein
VSGQPRWKSVSLDRIHSGGAPVSCPRRYRHRYLDGWQEKDTRAANSNPEILLTSISRYYKFLPGQRQQIFLENLREKAS